MPNDPLDLDALEAAEKAATPGPWESQYSDVPGRPRDVARGFTGSMICAIAPRQQVRTHAPGGLFPSADGRLIAALRNAAPALIASARMAERMAEALRFADEQLAWHADEDASDDDTSPEDMTAHVNGIVLKRVRAVLRELDESRKGGHSAVPE